MGIATEFELNERWKEIKNLESKILKLKKKLYDLRAERRLSLRPTQYDNKQDNNIEYRP